MSTLHAACLREATWVDDLAAAEDEGDASRGESGEGQREGEVTGEGTRGRRRVPPLTMWQLSFSGLSEQV